MRTVDDVPFALTLAAPAKLNLGLEVLGRRPDGYHDLATIFLTVSLFDEVSVAPAPGAFVGLACTGCDLPPQENLVWRAAEAMQQVAPGRGALLKLEKRIPVAAGLGGASSDAAAMLLALRELWQADVADDALAAMALALGSDVPFLLRGGCTLGGGRGEVLEELPVPGVGSPGAARQGPLLLIVAPRIQIPRKTASLFATLKPGDFSDGAQVRQQAEQLGAGRPLDPALLGNAFSRALYALRPDVAAVANAMREAGAEHVALSGAGPAHYALFDDMATAQLVGRRLEDRLGDTAEVFLTVPVPAREFAPLSEPTSQP